MPLSTIINRISPPEPWAEGEKIPWNDPEFSRRMLNEHLTQAHDLASRRFEVIDRHVHWIHATLLGGEPRVILDLGCGPGLYLTRLARLGHAGRGIDFSPASVEYARQGTAGLPVEIHEADLRRADFGAGYDLVMFIYGELNVFRVEDARQIIAKAFAALKPGGKLLLEVSSYDLVQRIGSEPPSWFTSQSGLFSDRPHLVLNESFWDAGRAVATERFFVLDGERGAVTQIAASSQAYTDQEYRTLLEETGFQNIAFHTNLAGDAQERGDIFPITAVKSNS